MNANKNVNESQRFDDKEEYLTLQMGHSEESLRVMRCTKKVMIIVLWYGQSCEISNQFVKLVIRSLVNLQKTS